ncbi:phosphonate metabolism protein/1,5-bisphosphokinase (PRPP-forming) PhnN [Maritimibacter sp. UBA3975]|uniref:phosphonate metabolism protein/1,5-bisphosphokinase (PRPP-forming) PhnN n=1 Tax=Maritimibacter sp. UBA3975 TaxID=1946833 RepID=UPI000C0B7FF9|nr:phosphonate metabolism protein/1,5-bisphosphokinase (PRPP-forming) PhnN [Maritimibacter sp. UBA3975]MAM63158.1 phosphonate metabolism protein/1,5-bisphosphokinase (PRPP-forming) PhnN [Maritimibacter sp.]|tara:strand:+ start:42021 stop:42560 length:540 start_codon:yes stop_codon:yes gene_type:complete
MSRVFAIVGPSGVGKDTVMEAVAARLPAVRLVRRVITRPSEAGGEDFVGVTEEDFARRAARGDFALHWQAHGLSYGIPAKVRDDLATGHSVLFNGSRAMLTQAAQVFPGLRVIHLTARREVLAKRLAQRDRETAGEIERRLDRAPVAMPEGLDVFEIDNSGALEATVTRLAAIVQPVRA